MPAFTGIQTEPYRQDIRIRSLWPPGGALHRETLALLPQVAAPDVQLLSTSELYRDGDGREPCYVLGPCRYDGTNYIPEDHYPAFLVQHWTRRLAQPQQEDYQRRREQDRKALLREDAERERAERWRKEELARVEREAKNTPTARLRELEETVRKLQVENQSLLATAGGYPSPETAPGNEGKE